MASCAPSSPTFTEITDDRVPVIEPTRDDSRGGPFGFVGASVGAAVGDVDGDGRPDVYLVTGGIFLNRADARGWRLVTAPTQPPVTLTPIGASFADFDRDGDVDLAICGLGGVQLFANDGAGNFSDVTAAAGIRSAASDLVMSVAWGDINGDGYLDLAVGGLGIFGAVPEQSHLFLNNRDGTFEDDVDPLGGHDFARRATVMSFADINEDGLLDLFVADEAGLPYYDPKLDANRHDLVLINHGVDGSGHPMLQDESAQLSINEPHHTMAFAVNDLRRTGHFDAIITDINAGFIYEKTSGPYDDLTSTLGFDLNGSGELWVQWGVVAVDLNGDGYEDLLVSQGAISGDDTFSGALLFMNDHGTLKRQRYAFGTSRVHGRAILAADLDGDGSPEFIATPMHDHFRVFATDQRARSFVRIALRGTVSAPIPAGAVVIARAGGEEQRRMLVSGSEPSSEGEHVLDVAWPHPLPTDLTIRWPSGAVQTVSQVAPRSIITVEEPRWLQLSTVTPPADGNTAVQVTIDVAAAGVGGTGAAVTYTMSPGAASVRTVLQGVADASGKVLFTLPPRTQRGPMIGTITVDGTTLGAHPIVDYR